MNKKFASGILLVMGLLLSVCTGMANADFDPVKGMMEIEGQNIHLQKFPILSYQMNADVRAAPINSRSTEGLNELTITRAVDRSSPLLTRFVTSGEKITEVKLMVYKAGDHSKYMLLTLMQAVISKINRVTPGTAQPNREIESLTFHFSKVQIEYYSAATNSKTTEKWDLQKASPER